MRLSSEASQAVARIAKVIWSVADDRKVFGLVLSEASSLFASTRGTIFLHKRASDSLYKVKSLRGGERWDQATLRAFFRNEKPELEADVIMAPVRVGDDVAGVLGLGGEAPFVGGAGKMATEMLKVVGLSLGARKRVAVLDDANRHARALAEGLSAKDTTYRVLHGLRRFIDYDHGATLVAKTGDDTARIMARQITWTKGKSDVVGGRVAFPWAEIPEQAEVALENEINHRPWNALASVREKASPKKGSRMIAVLTTGGRPIGLVELASTRGGFFRESDRAILDAYKPCLTLSLRAWEA